MDDDDRPNADFRALLDRLHFTEARKKNLIYRRVPDVYVDAYGADAGADWHGLAPMTFAVCQSPCTVTTVIHGQYETKNTARRGDVIIKGVCGEVYVLDALKFRYLYEIVGGDLSTPSHVSGLLATPRQDDGFHRISRMVAEVSPECLPKPIMFTAPWNEHMVLNPGDFLVKDGKNGFYRIEREAFFGSYAFV